jgi:hypothetical protein
MKEERLSRKVLYVCVFASLRQYEEPLPGDICK